MTSTRLTHRFRLGRLRLALPIPILCMAAALALALAGCGGGDPAGSCTTSADCVADQDGMLCHEGMCTICTSSAECAADPTYSGSQGLCDNGGCVACMDGRLDCPCDAGACTVGECVADVCTDCVRGDIGCICRANSTCSDGAVCGAGGLCEPCTDGVEFCPCGTGGSCEDGLVCSSDICVADTCVNGTENCPCDSGNCANADLYCDATDVCRVCTSDVDGCPCDPGDTCLGDLYCDTSDGSCVPCPATDKPQTCSCTDDVDCVAPDACDDTDLECRDPITCVSAGCVEYQECDESARDAICAAETCVEGYIWNPLTSACDVFVAETCVDGASQPTAEALVCTGLGLGCAVNPSGFVVCVSTCSGLDCTTDNRDCQPAAETYEHANCWNCEPGFSEVVDVSSTNEPVGTTDGSTGPFQGIVADPPIEGGTFSLSFQLAGPAAATAADDGFGNLTVGGHTGTIDYSTGAWTLVASGATEAAAAIDATYTRLVCATTGSANCAASDSASIAALCATRNRECVPDVGGAYCGDCLSGMVFDPDANVCVDVPRCGGALCTADEFCDFPQNGEAPRCVARCPEGEALNASDTCVSCTVSCGTGPNHGRIIDGDCACEDDVYCAEHTSGLSDPRCQTNPCPPGEATLDGMTCTVCSITCGDDEGERNRIWPFRTLTDTCFCETQSGYYPQLGGVGTPSLCDADADGWINDTADAAFAAADTAGDTAILANFRCDRRIVDRVELVNEYEQTREVGVCSGELYDWAPGNPPGACGSPSPIVLVESDFLDDENSILSDNTNFPPYGTRKLRAWEVNRLTKACVSVSADYNLNSIEDLQETQPLDKAEIGGGSDSELLLRATAFFVELHRGYYVAPSVAGAPGSYRVQERRRCDDDFPALYEVGRNDLYWEGCTRLRDATWNDAGPRIGLDFGQFACADAIGSCSLPAPTSTGLNKDGDLVDDHDLCALVDDGPLPANEPWLGMNHSSQFRCVQIGTGTEDYYAQRATLNGSGASPSYDFNSCAAVDCDGQGPSCMETTAHGAGALQPGSPRVTCQYLDGTVGNVPDDTVGLVAVRYANALGAYSRGCINESSGTIAGASPPEVGRGWSRLCDGFDADPSSYLTSASRGDFGKLICSCDRNYAGQDCEYSCPSRTGADHTPLHLGGGTPYGNPEHGWYDCDDYDYCTLVPPDSGFTGGRQGYWMCGEMTSTQAVSGDPARPGDPFMTGDVDMGSGAKPAALTGNVRTVPFVRQELKSSACASAASPCYELF